MIVKVGRRANYGAKSAVSHGGLQALSTCANTLKMPQAPEGLNCHKRFFASVFGPSKMKAPGRETLQAQQQTANQTGIILRITDHLMKRCEYVLMIITVEHIHRNLEWNDY